MSGYTAAIRHFDRLFSRYGGHVTALNLVRTRHSAREVRACVPHLLLSPTSLSLRHSAREVRACMCFVAVVWGNATLGATLPP